MSTIQRRSTRAGLLPACSVLVLGALSGPQAFAATINVPADHPTIQAALDVAVAGDRVEVETGIYHEKIVFPTNGTPDNPVVLTAADGAFPVLDGTGVTSGSNMVTMPSRSWVQLIGFVIRNNKGVSDESGVRVTGSGSNIEIRDNIIHDMRGADAMGITVYGTDPTPISDIVIDGNVIYDCEPAQSEALVLNGNVDGFEVTNNTVRDVNNIGLDFIGGEQGAFPVQPNQTLVARNGIVRGNHVIRANSNYGGGFGAGIYVDGGKNILIENNYVRESDIGIEIAAENFVAGSDDPGPPDPIVTQGIIVRNNVLAENERAGFAFGGFDETRGRANNNFFQGNTLYKNNTVGSGEPGRYFNDGGQGEIWIQWSDDNIVENNLVYAGSANVFVASYIPGSSGAGNNLDYNLYYVDADVENGEFYLNGAYIEGLTNWKATGKDANSITGDPLVTATDLEDFHLSVGTAPSVNAGNPAYTPECPAWLATMTGCDTEDIDKDLNLDPRQMGSQVDIGADEFNPTGLLSDGFE